MGRATASAYLLADAVASHDHARVVMMPSKMAGGNVLQVLVLLCFIVVLPDLVVSVDEVVHIGAEQASELRDFARGSAREDDSTEVGRRGGSFLSTTGSFSLSSGSNTAGNDEALRLEALRLGEDAKTSNTWNPF